MTTKSLTTFERRFGDWMHVHPTSDFFGKDENVFLSRQVSRIVESQLETADRIIASQKDISDKVVFGIERVSEGLESLRATFEWGFTEVIWRIEQTNERLQEILQVLPRVHFCSGLMAHLQPLHTSHHCDMLATSTEALELLTHLRLLHRYR